MLRVAAVMLLIKLKRPEASKLGVPGLGHKTSTPLHRTIGVSLSLAGPDKTKEPEEVGAGSGLYALSHLQFPIQSWV